MKRYHQSVRTHDDGTFGELVIVLLHSFQVVSRRVRLTDGTGREVHDLVPIPSDVGVQLRHPEVRPVPPYHSEYMSKTIGSVYKMSNHNNQRARAKRMSVLGYRSVDIRDDHVVCRIPKKYACRAPRAGRRERKRDCICAGFQIKRFLSSQ